MTVAFADISHYQARVDLAAYAAAGYDRIAMKATQGTAMVSPVFAERWREAGRLGLARVAYHYAMPANSGAAEADHFLRTVLAAGPLTDRDLLCLDTEDVTATVRADEHAYEFTARMAQNGYPAGCLYSGRWYAEPANIRPDDVLPGWRRLWISDYGTAPDPVMVLPSGWNYGQIIARQYTNRATTVGIGGACDMNRVITDWLPAREDRDMPLTPDDKAWLESRVPAWIRAALTTRQDPGAATPREVLAAWPGLVAKLTADTIDPATLAQLIAEHLGGAVTGVTQDQIEAALRRVFADAATPDTPAPVVQHLGTLRTPGGRRLGRHVEHDPRSRDYDVVAQVHADALTTASSPTGPRPIEWRRWSPILDQGNLGSCTGNAMTGWLGCEPYTTTADAAARFDETFAVGLYKQATRLDRVPGEYKPDDTGSTGLAVAKAARLIGAISSYRHAFTTTALLAALYHQPVIAGITWYDAFEDPDEQGRISLPRTATPIGGHEILIRGIVVRPGELEPWYLLADNSWGPDWGVGGSFLIPAGVWRVLRRDRADVTVPIA